MFKFRRKFLSFSVFNFCYAVWTVLGVYNFYFWRQVYAAVPILTFVVLTISALLFMMIFQMLIFHPKTVKLFAILLLLMNTLASYFINMYHVTLNATVLANILDTNFFEVTEWMGVVFWIYLFVFGFVPAWIVLRCQIRFETMKSRCSKLGCCLGILRLLLSVFIPYKTTVKAELKAHYNLRYQIVPSGYISGCISLLAHSFRHFEIIDPVQGMKQTKY